MISSRLYRWVWRVLGARTFQKVNNKSKIFVIVSGGDKQKMADYLLSEDYIEEGRR